MDGTINLIPGMRAEIGIRTDLDLGGQAQGLFAYLGDKITYKGTSYEVKNGWIVEDDAVGTIEKNGTTPSVIYTHKKPEKNALHCFDYKGVLKSSIYVIAVPIHDHSSIVQGGPAYATYFNDDESIE